ARSASTSARAIQYSSFFGNSDINAALLIAPYTTTIVANPESATKIPLFAFLTKRRRRARPHQKKDLQSLNCHTFSPLTAYNDMSQFQSAQSMQGYRCPGWQWLPSNLKGENVMYSMVFYGPGKPSVEY